REGAGRGEGGRRQVRRHMGAGARDSPGRRPVVTVAPTPAADRYINRELSWLAFNERVLEEAADATTPLLERAKFAAIVASNLDEFFMVRVAGLRHDVADRHANPDLTRIAPAQQLPPLARP